MTVSRTDQRIVVDASNLRSNYCLLSVFPAIDLKGNRYLSITACITARTWPLSKKPMGFLSDSGHARALMHAGITNPRWRVKRSRHSRRMRNPQFYGSGKRPMKSQMTSNTEVILRRLHHHALQRMMCCGKTGRTILIFDVLKYVDKSIPVISETILPSNQCYKMKIFRLNDMLQYIAKWFWFY